MSQIDVLVNRFLDDRAALGPVELESLIDGLRAQPAWAVALREQLVVDDLLAQKLTLDRRNFLAQIDQRIADFERAEADIDDQVAELRELATQEYAAKELGLPSQSLINSPWVRGGLALSLVTIALGFFLAQRWVPDAWQAHQRLPVATVVSLRGPVMAAEDDAETALAESTRLFTGQQIKLPDDSSLTLEYDDKTQVRVAGGSMLTFGAERGSGAKRIHITRGELWADVARQAAGAMEFSTPHAVAVVLGTRLRLTVTDSDTLLEVTEGLVRLDRLDRQESIDVAASEAGLATDVALDHRTAVWPARTDGLAYAFDPFVRRVPLARQSAGDKWFSSPLEPVGSVAMNELGTLDLAGGFFRSRDDGDDIVTVSRESSEFSLELVFLSGEKNAEPARRVVSLEANDGTTNFALHHAGNAWSFVLRTSAAEPSKPLRFSAPGRRGPADPNHMAITYGDGILLGYWNGKQVAQRAGVKGNLSAWTPATLLIGANRRSREAWRGTIHALAIYHRCLDADEVAQNVHNFQRLAANLP